MAVYNGAIRFAPDVYYEIKEMNDSDIQVLRNGVEVSGDSGSVLIANAITDETTGFLILDKTWQEIYDAFSNNTLVLIKNVYANDPAFNIELLNVAVVGRRETNYYYVNTSAFTNVFGNTVSYSYHVSEPSDYPLYED